MDSNWIRDQLEVFREFSDEGHGITRVAYTRAWLKAHEYVRNLMVRAGLEVRVDGMGNIIGTFKPDGEVNGRIATGSHIDSVRCGGNYDGVVGVLAAIEVVRATRRFGVRIDKQLDVIVFACEEAERFNIGCLGSKAIAGKLSREDLVSIKDESGKTLLEVVRECGFSGNLIKCRLPKGYYSNFFELHIEQGPVLESMNVDIGVVTSISAPSRIKLTFKGVPGHSGTVPMGYRRDALLPLAEVILAVRRVVEPVRDVAVGTVGYVRVKPNVATVIPGEATAIIEFRSINKRVKDQLVKLILERIFDISVKYDVQYNAEIMVDDEPIYIPGYIVELIDNVARRLGYSTLKMPSGASHDAAHMAEICDVGMIFIPCKGGFSHMSKEEASITSIVKGVDVLFHTIVSL